MATPSFVIPRVHPLLAAAAAIAVHSALSVLMFALPDGGGEIALALLALLAFVLPGALAGFLTTSRPLVVGLVASLGIWLAQQVIMRIALGAVTWTLMPGDVVQPVILCIAAVTAFHLRARLQPLEST